MKLRARILGLVSKITCVTFLVTIPLWLLACSTFQSGSSSSAISGSGHSFLINNSKKPLLQLRSGLTSTFSRMDLNIKLGLLAVGSQNNQVLLWSLNKNAAPRVFSTPILGKQSKRSHPVALDPEGRWIAYGVPGSKHDKIDLPKIFLFDISTGEVIQLLGTLESRPQSIRFSPDGNYLAASLAEGFGLRVWSTQNWELLQKMDPVTLIPVAEHAKLKLSDAKHPGLAFNPNQSKRVNLVMVGDSGIWCFGQAPDFKAVACLEQSDDSWIPADEAYSSVAFSPDGNRIAMGSRRTDRILIIPLTASENPVILVPPKSSHGLKQFHYLSAIAWSLDGRYIYAGGNFWLGDPEIGTPQNGIVRWDLQSNNQTQTYPAGTNTVMEILPFSSEGILYATQDPVIDVLGNNGAIKYDPQLFPIQSGSLDMRYWKQKNIVASKNGQMIAFKPYLEKEFIQFDLAGRNVSFIEQPGFEPAAIYQGAVSANLKNIRNVPATPSDKRKPSFNGTPLPMDPNEISRDYAFLPSGSEFIWLTSDAISLVQANGKTKWSKKLKHEGYRVLIADEGRLAIVAYSDGTIRWYLTQTGQRLLTLFIAKPKVDSRQIEAQPIDWKWIAWTPEGFYSSSLAGEQLIGWLINDPADPNNPIFYNFGTFRGKFYRPDVIEQILNVKDTKHAFRIANENAGLAKDEKIEDMLTSLINNAPPSVDILSPLASDILQPGLVEVCFKLRSPAKTVNRPREVNIFLNAGFVEKINNDLELNKKLCQKINIPDSLYTEGKALTLKVSVEGIDESLRGVQIATRAFSYEGMKLDQKAPRLLGLFVGISDYDQSDLKLNYAEKDAVNMKQYWKKQQGNPYREIDIIRIPGSEATRENILAGLDQLQEKIEPDDVVILYFAGHGATLSGDNRYLFFTRSAETSDTDKLLAHSVTDLDLKKALNNMKARFKMVFLDTCRNLFNSANPRLQRVDSDALGIEII